MSLLTLPATLPSVYNPPPFVPPIGTAAVSVGAVQVIILHGSISIQRAVGQRSMGSVIVEDVIGSQAFTQGQPLIVTDDKGNVAFSGVVTQSDRTRPAQTAMREHTVQFADWHYLADKRVAPYSAQNRTAGQIVNDLIAQFLASEGVTAGVIQTGSTVVSFVSAYGTVAECLDALVSKMGAGWYWLIDQNKQLQFQQQTTAPLAPYVADETIMERGTVVVKHGNQQYRNTQYMLGGTAQTSQQTETRQGDGKSTAFTMSYALSTAPTITLNGAAQTVALKSTPSGTAQWYWAPGDLVISQDTSGTKLLATDTLQVVYVGQFPNVTISQDGAAIATQQSRETYGSGVVEAAAIDTTLTSTTQAFQNAAGLLSKYGKDRDSIVFLTTHYGFAEGQLLTVNVPADGLNNEQMLIESVTITDVGPNSTEIGTLWYQVTAVSGPLNTGWVQFFRSLASQSNALIDSISVGQAQSLTLLQSVSETWAWTEGITETVYPCFIFPVTFPKTFC